MPMTEIPAPPPPPPGAQDPFPFDPQPAGQPDTPPEPAPEQPPAEPETPPAEPEPVVPAAPDPVQQELEDIRLKLEEQDIQGKLLEKQLEHERMLRDDAASKAGYYKRVATDLAAAARKAPPADEEFPSDTPRTVAPETARFEEEIRSLREDAIERAQVEALNHFFASNPDAREMVKDMEPFVAQARDRYAGWLESGDPKLIRRAAQMTLETGYLNAQKARTSAKRTERLTARASQLQRLADEKRAGAIPGSGAAAPALSQPKSIEQLSAAELEARLNALGRGGG